MAVTVDSAPLVTPAAGGAMDDIELAALLSAHEARAVGFHNSEIAADQEKALKYYYGEMDDLPALEGCSSAVDHTVAVTVDNGMAAILKPFVSSDDVVAFSPRSEEDEEQAEQATEYVNYIVHCDNPGFLIFHNWFKDALLQKLGIVKVWWEDASREEQKPVMAGPDDLLILREQPGYLDEQDNGDGSYTVLIRQHVADGRVRVENIPPEEFGISPFARTVETAPYTVHAPSNITRSDLVEMGFDPVIVEGLPAYAGGNVDEGRKQARYHDEEWFTGSQNAIAGDKSLDIIALRDEYVRVDYDGDGVAELRRVIRVENTILLNEPFDDAPFADICPVPMPHKVYGRSLAEQAVEGQKISTAVLRQTLDNLYKSNNPRPIVADSVANDNTWDDLENNSPGAAIRLKGGTIEFLEVPFTAEKSFGMLDYMAQQTEARTGIRRHGNGLDRNALKTGGQMTALQAAQIENKENERAEMIARIFAETGVKRLMKLILKLVVAHQPKERVIRLRNKWVPIDPRGWSPDMDLTVAVGLGVGNKNEQMAQADSVLETMAELGQTPYGYLLDAEKVHAAVKRKFQAAGIKNTDEYLVDPSETAPPEPQPSADVVKAQADAEAQKAKLQMDGERSAMEIQQSQAEGQAKIQLMREEFAAKIQLEREKVAAEAKLAQQKFEAEIVLAGRKMAMEERLAEQKMAQEQKIADAKSADMDSGISSNRPGGDLDK